MIKVLIVDDHAIVRRGLKELLTEEPDISVFEAGDGETASELIRKDRWDLIVLDLDLRASRAFNSSKKLRGTRDQFQCWS
jgi:DNA-binding NarL/FixJ family response regulator